jgi:type 1 glutamine amidotransferase
MRTVARYVTGGDPPAMTRTPNLISAGGAGESARRRHHHHAPGEFTMRNRLQILVALSLTVSCLIWTGEGRAQEEKIRALIVTGHDVKVHPWRETTPLTRKILEQTGRFEVKVSEDTGIFESSSLSKYDVILLNYGFWGMDELSEKGREGLLNFVRDGGGLVSLHFSSSSYQDWDEYVNLLGRVWKKGTAGHGPRGKFTVKIVDHDHPITSGMSDFEADDELYAKLSGDGEIHVLAEAYSEWSKRVEPLVFVKKYGKGNVVRNLLGHDVAARDYPAYIKLLIRGTEWAARGKVTSR